MSFVFPGGREAARYFFCGVSYMKIKNIASFFRENAVLTVAALAALITAVIVPPDGEYAGYFDLRTLSCLFCTLAVVSALGRINFFYMLAKRIVALFGTLRSAVVALVWITFIGSMVIANDMALITFLPLGYIVLSATGQEKHMAYVFVLQNIAANLGGMLTPFGNPQNLYIYTKFSVDTGEFMRIMVFPFLLSITLITACCLVLPKEPIRTDGETTNAPAWRQTVYIALFCVSIVAVFRVIPFWVAPLVIVPSLLFLDRRALLRVDYGLLFTFVFFFIFSGNMSRIPAVRDLISGVLEKNVLVVSALLCQFISNVPSAILLSGFTDNYPQLLLGVNIGGVGSIIASLASLITFREYCRHDPAGKRRYLLTFSAVNFSFLIILLAFCSLLVFLGAVPSAG